MIKIHKIKGCQEIPLSKLKRLQGSLKELSPADKKKLINSLNKYGFSVPIFTWKNYILDGHQRMTVVEEMATKDGIDPELPCIELPAKSLKEAKKLLLSITSQYGKITSDGLTEFIKGFDFSELKELMSFSDINLDVFEDGLLIGKHVDEESIPDKIIPITKHGDI